MLPPDAPRTDRATGTDLTGGIGTDDRTEPFAEDGRQGRGHGTRRATETERLLVSHAQHNGDVRASVGQGGGAPTARHVHHTGQGVRAIGPSGRPAHHLDTRPSG